MSIKDLVTDIKRNGLLASMPQLEELYQVAIENELKLAESQREFRAADAIIENLQMQVEKLAAENAGLKALIEQHANSVAVCPNCSHEEPSETDDIVALYRSMETPATDAFLAEVRASAVDEACLKISNAIVNCYQDEMVGLDEAATICGDFASQLRKGGATEERQSFLSDEDRHAFVKAFTKGAAQ